MRSIACWVGTLACLCACGPKVDGADAGTDEDGSSAEASEASASTATTTATSSTSTTATTTSTPGGGALGCCEVHVGQPGCDNPGVQDCVCALDPSCCDAASGWDEACVDQVGAAGCGVCPGGSTATTTGATDSTSTTGSSVTDSVTITTASATDNTSTSTTGGPSGCRPAPDDDICDSCMKDACCDDLLACYANPDCSCLVDCVQAIADVMTCLQEICMLQMIPAEALPLQSCASVACPDTCP